MFLIRFAVVAFVKIMLIFAPKKSYKNMLASILPPDEKNKGFDLRKWTYESVPSRDGRAIHRFYHQRSTLPNAPVLLCLHGLNWDGRTYLNFDSLADRFEIIAYDFPEDNHWYHGEMDDFVDLLADFVSVTKLERFHLAGTSFGGIIAQRFACAMCDSVQTLHLISTNIPGKDIKERSHRISAITKNLSDWQILCVIDRATQRFLKNTSEHHRERVRPLFRMKKPAWFRQLAESLAGYDGRECAKSLTCPVLVIHGMADFLIPAIATGTFRRTLQNVELVIIPGAGHDLVYNNAYQVCALIADFISRKSPH